MIDKIIIILMGNIMDFINFNIMEKYITIKKIMNNK